MGGEFETGCPPLGPSHVVGVVVIRGGFGEQVSDVCRGRVWGGHGLRESVPETLHVLDSRQQSWAPGGVIGDGVVVGGVIRGGVFALQGR